MKLSKNLKALHSKGGFTLIEILIVIALIGIVVGIAIPALGTAKQKAQTQYQNAVLDAVAKAKARYALDNNVTAGGAAGFNDIKPYLQVNGTTPSTLNDLISNPKSGKTGLNLGTYEDNTGVATPATWN
jgi:prepilin-type N-terminal cleavage/methylation domain-containing protein